MIDLLLAFDDETLLAAPLAAALGCPLRWIERHRFPDGESKLRLPAELPPRVALLRRWATKRPVRTRSFLLGGDSGAIQGFFSYPPSSHRPNHANH